MLAQMKFYFPVRASLPNVKIMIWKSIISQQIYLYTKIYLTATGKYPTLQSCGIRILVFSLNTVT